MIRIGCSGWHYKHWLGNFYPERLPAKRMLECYLRTFDTVELNNSFYRLPERTTFEAWAEQVPKGFLFSVKASRFLTHQKKLLDPEEPLDRLLTNASGLGKKLGPILFQLPPNLHVDPHRLENVLTLLPKGLHYTFEFRHESWFVQEIYDLLEKYRASLCIYDLGGFQSPIETTTNYTYIRLHGPSRQKYWGSYSDEQLKEWAKRIRKWSASMKAIYLYFDNDPEGFAPRNAQTLMKMLKLERATTLNVEPLFDI
jgi:uncharacterized protein YecE (DUF72 family)